MTRYAGYFDAVRRGYRPGQALLGGL